MNSVCKDQYSALCCEMKWMNLTIAILDFGVRLYGGSELSKHLSKCLQWCGKMQKIKPDPNFFYDERMFRRQCVNVIDTAWGRIYFSTCENFRRKCCAQCAMTLSVVGWFFPNKYITCKNFGQKCWAQCAMLLVCFFQTNILQFFLIFAGFTLTVNCY